MNDATDIEEDDELTPEEAEGIRLALEQAGHGEGMDLEQFREQMRAEFRHFSVYAAQDERRTMRPRSKKATS